MKRAFKKKTEAVIENSDDGSVEHLNKTVDYSSNHRMPSKAAMIALAISMGATSLLVTRQSDQALAAKPVGSHKASIKPAAGDTKVNFATTKSLEPQAVSSTSLPGNPAIVEPTVISQVPGLGAKLQAAAGENTVANTSSIANSSNSTSDARQPAKLATVEQQENTKSNDLVVKTTNLPDANEQLKAQQEFALNRLQEKSNRLKTGLAELRSEETNAASNNSVAVSTNSKGITTPATKASLVNKLRQTQKPNDKLPSMATPESVKPGAIAKSNVVTYQVKSGDTLAAIARMHGVSVSEIIRANKLTNPYQLRISQTLNIPKSRKVTNTANTNNQVSQQANHTGIGGDTPVPTAFVEMRVANRTVNQGKNSKNPRLNSLRKEIERLREKYRAQQSGKQVTPQTRNNGVVVRSSNSRNNNAAVPIPVPKPMTSGSNSRGSVRPQFFPNRFRNPVATPNRGRSDTDSLGRFRGARVSPNNTKLPPLAAVDRYLPRPIENTPKSSSTFIWPAKGVLTSGYGWRWGRMHRGIDIANSTGTPIYAAADGVVTKASWNRGGYGKLVEIRHQNGTVTRYAHNSKILVKVGQQVKQGKTIALMGSTGFSTGPHTHFEIRPAGKGAVNPIALLPARL
ncbi:MAG: peptidoglycan DD-metalloendopeptidase family protein [Calothrix sp. MO_192.B10]|nr:peptidoglycan DD-metalloendopeptidase family protein [Calothrix sp. MO_192.B10]